MDSIKMKGRNSEEAIGAGLKVLGLAREEAEIRVISEGKPGILGVFGGEEAEVEIFKKGSAGEYAQHFLQETLNKMGELAAVYYKGEEEGAIQLEIKGEDLGRVIGKDGAGLEALQQIVSAAASKRAASRVFVSVDAAGYRDRKRARLEDLATRAAEEVSRIGREKILEPMSAADRRLVHLALKSNKNVHTYSVGTGFDRSVVIAPGQAPAE